MRFSMEILKEDKERNWFENIDEQRGMACFNRIEDQSSFIRSTIGNVVGINRIERWKLNERTLANTVAIDAASLLVEILILVIWEANKFVVIRWSATVERISKWRLNIGTSKPSKRQLRSEKALYKLLADKLDWIL